MTTFTASEVRKLIERLTDHNHLPAVARACLALRAFADRLEADEKAQPVTWVNPDDLHNPNFVGINAVKIGHEGLGKHYTLPLYTHPDPADAGRLAEALRDARDCAQEYFYKEKAEMTGYLHHSALPTIGESLRNIDEALDAHASQAQPPAANVTDEMVERARSAFVRADDGSTGITDAIRAALLAAQENPNG